ncbi:hypothetical protein BVG81_002760 [Haliangium sp. UPWRP_2]|nr:hypothetical protein BVG81_002760 [Haliangium sp. UPWRP_2]
MRSSLGLMFLLCNCNLLPSKAILCAEDPRCEPVVPSEFVMGQPDEKTNLLIAGISTPNNVAVSDSGAVFVVDQGHERILAWNTFPTRSYQPADFAINTDNHSVAVAAGPLLLGKTLPQPFQISVSGNRLMGTNDGYGGPYNYMNFYSPPPTANRDASYVWAVNSGAMASDKTFKSGGPFIVGTHFYLVDRDYHRLLIWDSLPIDGTVTSASGVFGQTNFTNNAAGAASSTSLSAPQGVPASDGSNLLVADSGNHRVLLWTSLPTGTNPPASRVLGQSTMAGGTANRGQATPSASTLNMPLAVAAAAGNRVAVADRGNHRVLIWNQAIAGDGQNANVVLGQANFSDNSDHRNSTTLSTMNAPRGVATDGTRLLVCDSGNHRILIWTAWPTQSGQPADLVLGQPTPSGNAPEGQSASEARFIAPAGLARAGKQYFVVDRVANRVLVYAAPPTSPSDRPSLVLGQPDLNSSGGNNPMLSAASLNGPESVSTDGTVLAVADTGNHRVLVWRSLPTKNQQPADVILGQGGAFAGMANAGTAKLGLNNPRGVYVAGGRIYVADSENHRVLIWNSIPTQHQAAADVVLGQDSFLGTSANRGGTQPSERTLDTPTAVLADGKAIYVSDSKANRVLVYNTADPSSGQAADIVLGQDRFDVGGFGTVSEKSLKYPVGLNLYGSRLYVADRDSHRVVVYDAASLKSGQLATDVIGQVTLGVAKANDGGLSAKTLYAPNGVLVSESGVYIADQGNNRVLALPPRR